MNFKILSLFSGIFLAATVSLSAITEAEFKRTEFYRIKQQIDFIRSNLRKFEGKKDEYSKNQYAMGLKQIELHENEARILMKQRRTRMNQEKKMARMRLQNLQNSYYKQPRAIKRAQDFQKSVVEDERKLNEIEAMMFPTARKAPLSAPAKAPLKK